MDVKKVLGIVVGAIIFFYVVTNPTEAGNFVHDVVTGIITFLKSAAQ